MTPHFTEADLQQLGRAGAIDAMRRYLESTAAGGTSAPPRLRIPTDSRTLVFTAGADRRDDIAGFRFYSIGERNADGDTARQILCLLKLSTGEILATAIGNAFGAWRTAALGAVAMVEATKPPLEVAVLGAGFQAHHHTRTWAEATEVARFRVWARRPEAADAFVAALQADTGVPAVAVNAADEAVEGADAVLAATSSKTPVFEHVPENAYVATIGPKFGGNHELPAACYAQASFLFTDAPAQVSAFEVDQGPLPGGRRSHEFVTLADIVAGRAEAPKEGLRVFVSSGLSGTEVALLHALRDRTT